MSRADQTAVLELGSATRPGETGPPAPGEPTVADVTIRAAWRAIGLYLGLRVMSVFVLWLFAAEQHRSLLSLLGRYDAVHYAGIVTHGYDQVIPLKPDGGLAITNLAFFPVFPGLTALLDPILPGGAGSAGIAVSWLAGPAAAWGLFAIGAHLRDRRTGVLLAGLWAVLPHALVQSMGYTETLFTALAAWSLFALLRRHWLTAALLCVVASLTRPTGAALILVIGLVALVAVLRREDGWRPWVAAVIAPMGLLGYIAWVGHRLGRADGYFHVQNDAWKMSYDAGGYTFSTVHTLLTEPQQLAFYVSALVLLVAIALLVILALDRVSWPLLVYAAVIVAMAFFGDGYFHAKARLLMPAFSLLLPVAFALAAGRRRTAVVVLATLTTISAGYGIYLALVWTYSP
jgi:hypothetical protein